MKKLLFLSLMFILFAAILAVPFFSEFDMRVNGFVSNAGYFSCNDLDCVLSDVGKVSLFDKKGFDSGIVPVRKVSFVYSDPSSYVDEYAFLASIPNNVFRDNLGNLYVSPIVFGYPEASKYLLEDWREYCNHWDGVVTLDFIGPYSENFVDCMEDFLGVDSVFKIVADDPFEYATKIALDSWANSENVVIVPVGSALDGLKNVQGMFNGTFFNVTEGNYVVSTYVGPENLHYVAFAPPLESPHPYYNDMWEEYVIQKPGAQALQIKFDNITTEKYFDYIYVYDKYGNLVNSFTGSYRDVWTDIIIGDTARIVLSTDSSVTSWGFKVSNYKYWTSLPLITSGVWFNSTFYVSSDTSMIRVYLYTNETYSVNSWVTAYLIDPRGKVVDYSFNTHTIREYAKGWDVEEPYGDLLFWVNGVPGLYKFSLFGENVSLGSSIAAYARVDQIKATRKYTLSVPENASLLTVHLDVSNSVYSDSVHVALIDPYGDWIFGDMYEGEDPYLSYVSVKYPVSGDWTIVVWCDPSSDFLNEKTDYRVYYSIETYSEDLPKYFESTSNGAVIASLMDCPLLYVANDYLPESTLKVLKVLGVRNIVVVDPYDLISENVISDLQNIVVESVNVLDSLSEVVSFIYSLSEERGVVLTVPNGNFFIPAALLASYHGIPVLSFNGLAKRVVNLAEATWGRLWYSHDSWLEEFKAPHFYWMNELSNAFFDWIEEITGDSISYVVTVASIEDVMVTFERAIVGGVMSGRIPGYSAEEDVIFIDRSILYPALIGANPNYDKVLDTLVAYQCGWWILTNFGENVTVDDALLTSSTKHQMVYHIGEYEVYDALNDGVALWYYADHGGQGYTWWNYKPFGPGALGICYNDTGWRAYEVNGSADNPDTDGDGIVNPWDMIVDDVWGTELDENLENVHSAVCVFMACLVGSSQIPVILMRHGALAVTADIRTLYFGYGYAPALFVKELYSGKTFGEALLKAINETSYNYYAGCVSKIINFDSYIRCPVFGGVSVQYVLYGDPKLALIDPTEWSEPDARNPLDVSLASGHVLGGFERSVDVDLTSPVVGSVVHGTVSIRWEIDAENTVIDDTVLSIDGKKIDVMGQTSYLWDTTKVSDGNHTISITVRDAIDNMDCAVTWVIVNNTVPSVRILSPTNNSEVSGVVKISWSSEGEIKQTLLIIDDIVYDVTGLTSFDWNSTILNDGTHRITVTVVDVAGDKSSDTVFVITKNISPVIKKVKAETYRVGIITGSVVGLAVGAVISVILRKRS